MAARSSVERNGGGRRRARLGLAVLPLVVLAAAAPAQSPPALAGLEAGRWEIVVEGQPPRNLCLPDAGALAQLHHAGTACERRLIGSEERGATIHYSCPGAGWGRTTVRALSATHARIETQGIAAGAPFAYAAEAHRTGTCAPDEAAATAGGMR